MEQQAFIAQLLAATEEEWQTLLQAHAPLVDRPLAWALKAAYDEAAERDPLAAAHYARLVTAVASRLNDPEVDALAIWLSGLVAMDQGQFAEAHAQLSLARDQFIACNQPLHAAATQISNFRVLAMLGRDEEAIQWGEWARSQFEAAGDQLALGKIELNLGTLYFFRDRYTEAEVILREARAKFIEIGDQNQLLSAENNLGIVLVAQYKFAEVASLYERALARAKSDHDENAIAMLECNLGYLALCQGHFDEALDYLERSRRRYTELGMRHESMIADQEIADAYLELNLAPEAAAIYARVIPLFAELGMRAEQARALTYHGRALLLQGQLPAARGRLTEAGILYQALDNPVGEATIQLYLAEAAFLERDFPAVDALALSAETAFTAVNAWGRLLQARWLRGEAAYHQGQYTTARRLLDETLQAARDRLTPQIAHRCLTTLGRLAGSNGDAANAERYFKEAVTLIEQMRAPLPAEAFRIAFLSDKLTPYRELVRLCLADGTPTRIAEALGYVEQARARALLDLLGDLPPVPSAPADPFSAEITARIETLREELNWFYSQINRPDSPDALRGATALAALQEQVQTREAAMVDLLLQRGQQPHIGSTTEPTFDLQQLRAHLGSESILVEYFTVDEALLAFVVTDQLLTVIDLHCREEDVQATLQQFHFQLGALRYDRARMDRHQAALTARANHHLAHLYDLLLQPIAPYWGTRRLVVAPLRSLHYVPFHALYDGAHYVMATREICYTPSAAVLHHCLQRPTAPLQQALLFGVPDRAAPRIQDEITNLTPLFPATQVLLHGEATRAALTAHAPTADLLHLACHGRFRNDNPLFSALQLSDGWLTVHDAAQLNLHCNLVTLSACETGLNAAAPGDEILGLTRGFLLAGAPALLMSLWTVDDSATATFMQIFYTELQTGVGTAAALRHAQLQLLATHPHPFFWAPFILVGRWT